MTYNQECVTCKFLPVCTRTSTQKVLSHYVCEYFEEVVNPVEVIKARCDVINMFGDAGVLAIAPCKKEPNG